MNDLTNQADGTPPSGSCIVSILPYRLRALRRRHQAALAAELAQAAATPAATLVSAPRVSHQEPGGMRAGIRHVASGRMTVIHAGPRTALAMLTARTAHRRGLLEDERLEAIVVDGQRQVFAGFWPN